MLGREVVDDLGGVRQIADEHHRARARAPRRRSRAGRRAASASSNAAPTRSITSASAVIEERPRLRIVLGLRDQVERGEPRVDGGVGHDREFARPGQPVDPHDAGDLPLGLGDVRVARSHDPIDRRDGRRPERQCADRLRAARLHDDASRPPAARRTGRPRGSSRRAAAACTARSARRRRPPPARRSCRRTTGTRRDRRVRSTRRRRAVGRPRRTVRRPVRPTTPAGAVGRWRSCSRAISASSASRRSAGVSDSARSNSSSVTDQIRGDRSAPSNRSGKLDRGRSRPRRGRVEGSRGRSR